MNQDEKDRETLHKARRMHVAAMQSGQTYDFILAAELFEKCGHYDDARTCREVAERLENVEAEA